MPYKRMKLVPKPGPDATVIAPKKAPAFVGTDEGEGKFNFVCGHCEEMLAKKLLGKRVLMNLIIKCPNCGQYNSTEG